jgi:phosphohistidine phosphatase
MIHVYLVRHAAAVEGDSATPDAARALTTKGRKRFHKIARALGRHGEKLDAILTSPLVRAVQTAEILAGEIRHGEVAVLPELAPGQTVDALLRAVAKRAGKGGSVALVGHEPQLSSSVAALAHLSAAQSSKLEFKSGAVVRIDVSDLPAGKTAQPRWWLKPRSGARRKGLPLQEPKAKQGAAARQAKAQRSAKEKKKSRPKPAPKAKARSSAPKPKAAAVSKPAAAPSKADAVSPARNVPQKFMGSPRSATPPPTAPAHASPAGAQPAPSETKPE